MLTENILAAIVDNAEIGIYVSDFYTGEILFANQKLASLAKCSTDVLIGKKCWEVVNHKGFGRCPVCPYEKLVDDAGKPTGKYSWEFYMKYFNMWFKCINQAVIWVDGRLAHVVTFYDITETKALQDSLANLAFFDPLLHLKNELKLEQDIRAAASSPSLIIFDVTSMQKINEAYGRDVGDHLLISMRDWILRQGIPNSELYRIGGDEFCLAVGNITPKSLDALAGILHQRFSQPWIFESNKDRPYIFCTVSTAIIHGEYIQESESLLNLIERTLESAKSTGKVTVYSEEMDRDFKKRVQLELSLKRCVQEGMRGFDVYYQPIADPVTGTWCGLEALCRWNSPELGAVSPQKFIPEAERLDLIGIIGLWVLETAVSKCKAWGLDKHNKFVLDVNLSALQFLDEMLAPRIIKTLYSYDFPGEKLSIEITESTQFTFTDQSLYTIELLRENNVLVALDDFGTGYSSFNNLEGLPVDILKIERIFVTNIETDSYQQYLFRVMADLAHSVDMKLIAEGVENEGQLDILLKNGADLLQGYLFSKPLSSELLETKLDRFYHVDEAFGRTRRRKIDINKLLGMESNYTLMPNHYRVLDECMHTLFYQEDTDEAVKQVLQIMGRYMDVCRAYIFLQNQEGGCQLTYEWNSKDVKSWEEYLDHREIPGEWAAELREEGAVLTSDISALPEGIRVLLLEQCVKATAVLPLWDGQMLFGFVGFDDCRYFRDWRPEEILMLHSLCMIIANVLNKRRMQKEAALQNNILRGILNRLDMPVYVSEIESGRILFANRYLKDNYEGELEGRICWEALYGKDEKCEFCKTDRLQEKEWDMDFIWGFYNPVLKKHYRVYDSLIQWSSSTDPLMSVSAGSSKKVHLGYAMDMTFLKEYEQQYWNGQRIK